jgi:pimeloyl-ACP methyl ester carboxylesterase
MNFSMSVNIKQYFWCVILAILPVAGHSQGPSVTEVGSGVRYELISNWSKEKLNQILKTDFPKFSGVPFDYGEAKNGVNLYRVTYRSVIPEQANKSIQTSGLVAVPDNADAGSSKTFPMLSYQHGTVYGKNEVPSIPDESPETQLMLAQFGGQGYVVMGADYFGMGRSPEPEGYMVKGSHQQASYDMLLAGQSVLNHLKIKTGQLFLSGWSQGGFVTMAFLEKLEKEGIQVAGAATASAPIDVFAILNGFMNYPRPIDAAWINSLFILSAFSFENYYNVPGLAHSVLNEKYHDIAKKAYLREKVNPADIPSDLRQLVRPEYFDKQFFAASQYGRLLKEIAVYQWIYETPVRNYYGEADEAIPVGVGRLAMTYQQAIGSGNNQVTAISTGNTSHRGTYAVAAPEWKKWFDSLLRK